MALPLMIPLLIRLNSGGNYQTCSCVSLLEYGLGIWLRDHGGVNGQPPGSSWILALLEILEGFLNTLYFQ